MTNLISLLLLLCVGFLMVAATDFVLPRHADGPETSKIQTGSDRLDKLLVLMCTTGCCIAIYAGKAQNRCCPSKRQQLDQNCTIFYVPMGIYFFFIFMRYLLQFELKLFKWFNFSLCFSVLLTVVSKPTMNEVYLIIISYFILVTFLTIQVSRKFSSWSYCIFNRKL